MKKTNNLFFNCELCVCYVRSASSDLSDLNKMLKKNIERSKGPPLASNRKFDIILTSKIFILLDDIKMLLLSKFAQICELRQRGALNDAA